MQFYLCASPESCSSAPAGCRTAHLAYRISKDGHLMRKNLPANTRRGLLTLTGTDFPALDEPASSALCREIIAECTSRDFEGVLADFTPPSPAGRSDFLYVLAAALNRNSRKFYVVPPYGMHISSAVVPLCTAISGGSFTAMLSSGIASLGRQRVALDLERLMMDFTLPCSAGIGTPMTAENFSTLYSSVSPSVFYSADLCAKYFTYTSKGKTHFVLFDDADTLNEKIRIAQRYGIGTAFLQYSETNDILSSFMSQSKKRYA